jgi:hypothetical protein
VNPAALFAAIAAIPRLPGARCRGRHELFDPWDANDPDRPDVEEEALALCRCCPALAGCEAWFDSLGSKQRPHGVVAGRVNHPAETATQLRGRPPKAVARAG